MHFCYIAVTVLIAVYQTTHVLAKHSNENVINLEVDVPKIVKDLLKVKGLKVSPDIMDGIRMRSDSDDYYLKIKLPQIGNFVRSFLLGRRDNSLPTLEVGGEAIQTEIVQNPGEKLQNDLKNLLAIKEVLDERNKDVNN